MNMSQRFYFYTALHFRMECAPHSQVFVIVVVVHDSMYIRTLFMVYRTT